jgi:hypothetical protein
MNSSSDHVVPTFSASQVMISDYSETSRLFTAILIRCSRGIGSRSEIALLVGFGFGTQMRCAFEQSRKSAEQWLSRNCHRAALWAKVGTASSLLVVEAFPAFHVSGGRDPQASATPAKSEAGVQPPGVVRTTQGVEPGFDRDVTLVGHDQVRLIEDHLRCPDTLLAGAPASVSNITPKVLHMLKIDHRFHLACVYAHAKAI